MLFSQVGASCSWWRALHGVAFHSPRTSSPSIPLAAAMATTTTATSSVTLTCSLPTARMTTHLMSLLAPQTFLLPLLPVCRMPTVDLAQLLAAEAHSMVAHAREY